MLLAGGQGVGSRRSLSPTETPAIRPPAMSDLPEWDFGRYRAIFRVQAVAPLRSIAA